MTLQVWVVDQLDLRAPHAADLFTQDSECLYDAFLSVLIGTGLGFIDYDDTRFHHGLYASGFFVGDIHAPPRCRGTDGPRESHTARQLSPTVVTPTMCHAIVDIWLGDVGRHIHFVASMIASMATLELVAGIRIDECVFKVDLPPDYARSITNRPWEDGSPPIGSLDACLLVEGPLIHLETCPRYKGQALSPSGFTKALTSVMQMGLAVESPSAFAFGAIAALRAPHGGPEMLGWVADAVVQTLSACGYTGGMRIRTRFAHIPSQ